MMMSTKLRPLALLALGLCAASAQSQTIATGARHALAVAADGSVLAWGDNRQGQLGAGRADDVQAVREIPLPAKAVAVQASATNALLLDDEGKVWSWGTNRKGQLGDGTLADRATPEVIFRNAARITFNGGDYGPSSLIDKDGQPWWWGPLPGGAVLARPERSAQVGARLVWLVQEGQTTAALDEQGVVWSWGPGAACASPMAPNGPVAMREVPPIRRFVLVDSTPRGLLPSGEERTPRSIIHAEDRDGNVWKWGSESMVSWASPTRHHAYCPPVRSSEGKALLAPYVGPAELLQDGAVFTKITGREYTPAVASQALSYMGLTDRGDVWLWRDALPPAPVGAITGAVRAASGAIDASVYSSRPGGLPSALPGQSGLLYITRDGRVHAKGSNANLHLATGRSVDAEPVSSPQRLPLPGPALSVHAQPASSFAVLRNGQVWSWGPGAIGQQWGTAGAADPMGWYTLPTAPAQVPIPASIRQLAVAQSRWLAVDNEGRVWSSGELGNGVPLSTHFTATLVGQGSGMPRARSVALALLGSDEGYLANPRYAMVLGVDGSVWTIGRMVFPLPPTLEEATLRLNTPQKVAGLPPDIGQITVAGGANGTAYYALDASGAVWFWGQHDSGLGGRAPADVPPETVAMVPSVLPLPAKAVSIHGGPFAFCAVLDDGTAYCRGRAFNGHLGLRFSLQAAIRELSIGGAEQAASPLAEARPGTLHLRLADGTVWAWGQGRYGQLGNGTFANAAEPVPVADEAGTGDLDLDPATPNVPAATQPPFRVRTRLAGNLRALSFRAEVFGAAGAGGATTNVYAIATADLRTWMQLDGQGQWSLLRSPVPAALANVPLAGEARSVALPLLPQLAGTGLAGVRVFVGQGRDAQEMLQAQRFREVLELAPED